MYSSGKNRDGLVSGKIFVAITVFFLVKPFANVPENGQRTQVINEKLLVFKIDLEAADNLLCR